MIDHLKQLIFNIQDTSEQVAAASQELTASAEQSAQATGDIANSINEIADLSVKQVEEVNNTTAVVQQISASLKQV
ncbi:hypothetical protein [Bacillus massiliigorillae]|uniref:hypothetical protein n=1 Tax=Bacillus massiliigorillae TaxID=1243664 RepID=UPI0003A9F45E|nr:hypothetical protein [Bacillus massiliigorillae]